MAKNKDKNNIMGAEIATHFLGRFIDKSQNYGRENIKSMAKKILDIDPDKSLNNIMDIGCGHGTDLLNIADLLNNEDVTLTGLDLFGEQVESIQKFKTNIEYDEYPVEDSSQDIIVSNQVFEHCKELYWVNHQIAKKLKVGGYLILGVPNLAALHNRLLLLLGRQPSSMKSYSAHIRGFTKTDLLNFFNVCWKDGYQLKAFSGAQFYPFPKTPSKILAKILPNMAWSIFILLRKTKDYDRNAFLEQPIKARLETSFYTGDNNSN